MESCCIKKPQKMSLNSKSHPLLSKKKMQRIQSLRYSFQKKNPRVPVIRSTALSCRLEPHLKRKISITKTQTNLTHQWMSGIQMSPRSNRQILPATPDRQNAVISRKRISCMHFSKKYHPPFILAQLKVKMVPIHLRSTCL